MTKIYSKYKSLIFEELEPRLLFSADGAEALAAEVVEQEVQDQPIIIIQQQTGDQRADSEAELTTAEDTQQDSASEGTEETSQENIKESGVEELEDEDRGDSEQSSAAGTDSNAEAQSDTEEETQRSELILVNDDVVDHESLVEDIENGEDPNRTLEVIVLDSSQDGFEQVTGILQDHSDLDAIHFVTHGSESFIGVGNDWLNDTTLDENRDAIASWGDALSETGDILFYGCNIAPDSDGQDLLVKISELTGADVAASDDITGHDSLGGDWELEFQTGKVESASAATETIRGNWTHQLATYTVTSTADDGSIGTLRWAINQSNASAAVNDTITFNIAPTDAGHFYYTDDGISGQVSSGNITATTAEDDASLINPDPDFAKSWYTIGLTGALPSISDTVIVDGTSQPGFVDTPIIELDGNSAGPANGLQLTSGSGNSRIEGFVINDFGGPGIVITSDANTIVGNFIGTDVSGSLVQGNSEGIYINNAANNVIGGTTSTEANIIAGSTQEGLEIRGAGSTGTIIQGNYIGTNPGGDDLGNLNYGVLFWQGATGAVVGGTAAGAGNVIAYNDYDGVTVYSNTTGHSILGNSIYANAEEGIELNDDVFPSAPLANDAGDGDGGNNNQQNYPVITEAYLSGSEITVSGTLDTDGTDTQYRIELFVTAAGIQDATHGEGAVYLGTTTITTNGTGDGAFSALTLSDVSANVGDYITATATRIDDPDQVGLDDGSAYGDTSEFSAHYLIADGNDAPTFGTGDGSVLTNFAGGDDKAEAVAIQPDGKTLVAGHIESGGFTDFALTRYHTELRRYRYYQIQRRQSCHPVERLDHRRYPLNLKKYL